MHAPIFYLFPAVTFAFAAVFCWKFPPLAKRLGLASKTSFRRLEASPIPLMGGLAIFASAVVVAPFAFDPVLGKLLLAAAPLIALAVLDDLKEVRARWKLLAQIVASIALVAMIGPRDLIFTKIGMDPLMSSALAIFIIISMCNAYNFLDGIDGQVGTLALVNLLVIGLNSPVAAFAAFILAGGVVAFLMFNRPPAKIYLGEAGSSFLGFTAAGLAMWLQPGPTLSVTAGLMLLFSVPFCDIFLAIIRRKSRKESVTSPDREHFHHKLLRLGLNKWQCLAVVGVMVASSNAAAHFYFSSSAKPSLLVAFLVSALLISLYVLVSTLEKLVQKRVESVQSYLTRCNGTEKYVSGVSGSVLFEFDLSKYLFELAERKEGAIDQLIQEMSGLLHHLIDDCEVYLVNQSRFVITSKEKREVSEFQKTFIAKNIKDVLASFHVLRNALEMPEGLKFKFGKTHFGGQERVIYIPRQEPISIRQSA